jgi:predicted MPP superfamily phosphohydrolase
MDRRKFVKLAAGAALGAMGAGGMYPLVEAKWCHVLRATVRVPNLPAPFVGTTVALISDVHHGPYVPRVYIRHAVALTNALRPDIVALCGDYVFRGRRYIAPGIAELGKLRARLGRFAVLGNHDHYHGVSETRDALARAGITEVDNSGVWLERGGARLRVCGVDDFWHGVQDLDAALGSATERDAVVLLSHNPDYVEEIADRRVGLVLSGHTHGGQVVVPCLGAPRVPSMYGQKYLQGLVQGPACQVFVTRGLGTVAPPVRFHCPPEVALITLQAGAHDERVASS